MTDEERQKLLDLIKQAKEGNESAFTRLYNRFHHVIYNTIFFIVRNTEVTNDLVSVTFMKAFKKLDSYINNISFEMWLKTIAINTSIDYIRHTKKENANYWIDDEANFLQLTDKASLSVEDELILKEKSANLSKALEHLRSKYKDIIELRANKELSYKQIGDILGISESQVKSQLNRARKKLKKILID